MRWSLLCPCGLMQHSLVTAWVKAPTGLEDAAALSFTAEIGQQPHEPARRPESQTGPLPRPTPCFQPKFCSDFWPTELRDDRCCIKLLSLLYCNRKLADPFIPFFPISTAEFQPVSSLFFYLEYFPGLFGATFFLSLLHLLVINSIARHVISMYCISWILWVNIFFSFSHKWNGAVWWMWS